MDYGVAITTTANRVDAREVASALVSQRLAACVQLLDIESHYVWDGAVQQEPEVLLLIKCRKDKFSAIQTAIRAIHKYTTPEIVLLPIQDGLPAYLKWIDDVAG